MGSSYLHWLFLAVFVVILLAEPFYSWRAFHIVGDGWSESCITFAVRPATFSRVAFSQDFSHAEPRKNWDVCELPPS